MTAMRAQKLITNNSVDTDGLATINGRCNSENAVNQSDIDLVTKMVLPSEAVEAIGHQGCVALDVVVRIGKTLADGKMNFSQVAYAMG